MLEALGYDFLRNALLAGLLASLACGVVGSLVVVNRLVFLVGGVAHAAYGGVGLAFFLGISPLLGAVGFSLAAAGLMAWVALTNKSRADAIIGVLWALGMALGVILVNLTPGYTPDLMAYLFGSLLAVPETDLYLLAGLDLLILAVVGRWYRHFLALSFDDEFAAVRGLPVKRLYVALVALSALAVVCLMRVTGLILVIALVTIPPYVAESWSRDLKTTMALATVLGAAFTLAGLALAFHLDLTAGPSVILVAGLTFFVSLGLRRLWPRRRS